MSRKTTGSRLVLLVIGMSLGAPAVSWAQNTVLEEIVVTAQKRDQNLQDVAISITAFSGKMIDDFGFEDTRDLFYQTPNVSASQQSFSAGITIRGNATFNNSLGGEGNVALYFDEIYRPASYYGGSEMLDIERVEVLRGPQGTLFGRNSTGGLVHFISRKPTDELEGYASLEYGSYSTRIFEGAISGPFSDRVRGRMAFKYHADDGFQTNQGPAGGKLAVTDRWASRGQLEFDLSEEVNLLLSVEASDADDIGKAFNYWGLLDPVTLEQCEAGRIRAGQCVGAGAYFGLPTFSDPTPSVKRPYTELDPNNGDGRYTLETLTAFAKLHWQLSDSTELVSITAYDSHDRFFNTDEDASVAGVYNGVWSYNDTYTTESDQLSQEFRLSGTQGVTDWMLGFFYIDVDGESTSAIADFQVGTDPDTTAQLSTQSWAVFGDFGRPLSDTLRVIGGFRYTDEEKKADVVTLGLSGSQQFTDDNLSGRLGLEWRPRDEWMVYGTVSSGFRSGNFNTDLLFGNVAALTAANPEKVLNFELGSKSTLLDGRMRLNATLFYQDVKDKQGTVYDSSMSAPVSRLISVGDADIYGAELEMFLVPTENLELSLGVGWLDSEIKAPAGFGAYSNFGTGDNAFAGDFFFFDGSELPGGWGVNGVVRYHIPLTAGSKLTLQTDFDWREDTIGLGGNDITYDAGRMLVNLRAFWHSPSERWEVQAYVENAFDEKYIDNMYALAGADYAYGNMGLPMWYGIKLSYSF